MRENADQKNSKYEHFLGNVLYENFSVQSLGISELYLGSSHTSIVKLICES